MLSRVCSKCVWRRRREQQRSSALCLDREREMEMEMEMEMERWLGREIRSMLLAHRLARICRLPLDIIDHDDVWRQDCLASNPTAVRCLRQLVGLCLCLCLPSPCSRRPRVVLAFTFDT